MSFDLNECISTPIINESTPWSELQSNIFDFVLSKPVSLIVEAVAGSGKTTTMVETANRLLAARPELSVAAVAFNKTIAATLARKMPSVVDAKTFHALCLTTFPSRPKVNSRKNYYILKDLLPAHVMDECGYSLQRLISLGKNNYIPPEEAELLFDFMDDYDIFLPEEYETQAMAAAITAYRMSIADRKEIDFDDMLYFPLYYEHTFPKYNVVFVDEAQDLSPLQHELLEQFLAVNGRIIAFGDSRQAIYGFRGADMESMSLLKNTFSAEALPLSISYRCPVSVVEHVQRIVPQITSAPGAEIGSVEDSDLPDLKSLDSNSFILCRNNAPILRLGMKFIKEGIPVTVRTNLGPQLNRFIDGFKTQSVEVLLHRLEDWYSSESERLIDNNQMGKLGAVTDKYEACKALAEGSDSVRDMKRNLASLLSENPAAPVLSTIHKAKGEEAKHVYFYLPELIPSRFAKTQGAIAQEWNLYYVACTRAMETLTFISEGE